MGKCYCDYCDVFLTNDSVTVRKQHNDGNRHKYNVCEYYRKHAGEKLQEQIDEIVEQFEIKVAKGLINPTYGIPPSVKQDNQQEDADNGEKEETKANTDPNQSEDKPEQPSESAKA